MVLGILLLLLRCWSECHLHEWGCLVNRLFLCPNLSLIGVLVHWCVELIYLDYSFLREIILNHFVLLHPAALTSGVCYSSSRRTSSCLWSTTTISLESFHYIHSFLRFRIIGWLLNQILGCKLLQTVSCLFNAVRRTEYVWENELLIINVCWPIFVLTVHYLPVLYLLLIWTTPNRIWLIIIIMRFL